MPFAKPENALKRAEEFIDVGKKRRALDTLYELIRSKKHRTWQKIHEQIMKSYLTLCVELRESHMAKDGLHQYKTICVNVNVKSLEDVINGFLQLAEEKAEKAKKDASAVVTNAASLLTDVDDLEYINSPESVLLKAVSGESTQDRADRDLLAPWLKFVWESYKQCLDLLKNNNKVETLYQQIAKQAFSFCVKYQRKTEFRKLCETLRQHMIQGHKYSNQTSTSIDLSKPETQNNHLETRLLQLNYAISMELWQEAYKAVEDIYALMNLSKTKVKPQQMFNYYSKLSLIFWKAGNHLFHAATLQKLYVLLKEQKKTITQEELTKISTRQLLATLAIPITPNRSLIDECLDQDEVTLDKLKRLSSLLNLPTPPTRFSLLKDLAKYNVLQHVFPEIRDLYKCLEVEFNPLKLSERVNKCLDYLESRQDASNENYVQYIQAIKEITVTRLLKQISQIYTTIEIKRFLQLAPKGIDSFTLEKLIVDSAKQLDLQIRINHQTKSLHFGNDLYVSQRDELQEGPSIQSMPSEQIRTQLVNMGQALQQAQQLICGQENKSKLGELATTIANVYRQTCDKHHTELLKRKQFIEKQKEIYENLAIERERIKNEEKRLKQEEKDFKLNKFASISERAGRDSQYGYEEERLRAALAATEKEDDEINRQIEQANKERREFNEKLKKEEKKYDHFVRACHENEIPLIQKFSEQDAETRRKFWEEKEIERIENLKEEQKVLAENRERLLRMSSDKEHFLSQIHAARKADYDKKIEEFKVKLVSAREAKLRDRKEKRKTERRTAHLKAIEDKKKKEEDERRAKEDEEKRRKQNEQAEKQRKREQEIEDKIRQQHQQQPQQQPQAEEKASAPYRPKAAGGVGFAAAAKQERPEGESSWRRGPNAAANDDPWRRDERQGGEQSGEQRRRIILDEDRPSGGRDFGSRGGDRGDRGERGDFSSRGGDRGDRGDRGERDFGSRGGDRGERGDFSSRGGDRGERSDFSSRGGDRGERGDFGSRGGDRGGERGERGDFGSRGGDRGGERGEGGRDFNRDRDNTRGGGRGGGFGGPRGGDRGGERGERGGDREDRGERRPGGPPSRPGFGGESRADTSDNWRRGPN